MYIYIYIKETLTPYLKFSINRKILFFLIIEVFDRECQIRRQGFLEAGCDGTRSEPSALHFVPRCLQSTLSRRPRLALIGPKKINTLHPFFRQEVIIHLLPQSFLPPLKTPDSPRPGPPLSFSIGKL